MFHHGKPKIVNITVLLIVQMVIGLIIHPIPGGCRDCRSSQIPIIIGIAVRPKGIAIRHTVVIKCFKCGNAFKTNGCIVLCGKEDELISKNLDQYIYI